MVMARSFGSTLCAAGLVVALSAIATCAWATSVTYTGFTLANGRIGTWAFTNAEVTITFRGDTSTVQTTSRGGVNLSFQPTGTASVKIAKGEHVVHANFTPNLIFVSMDQSNGGAGFGYFDSSGITTPDHVASPTYPLGICCGGGSVDISFNFYRFIFMSLSHELLAEPIDLASSSAYSGRAYICPTFPMIDCFTPPTVALPTDKGDLYLYAPYVSVVGSHRPQNAGFFTAVVGP
jgi:hypothetical protein